MAFAHSRCSSFSGRISYLDESLASLMTRYYMIRKGIVPGKSKRSPAGLKEIIILLHELSIDPTE